MTEPKIVRIRELETGRILWQSEPVTTSSTIERLMNGAMRNLDRDRCVVEAIDITPTPEPTPEEED